MKDKADIDKYYQQTKALNKMFYFFVNHRSGWQEQGDASNQPG